MMHDGIVMRWDKAGVGILLADDCDITSVVQAAWGLHRRCDLTRFSLYTNPWDVARIKGV